MKRLIRRIYELIPFKNWLLHQLRFLYNPSDHILKHLHFKGIISVPVSRYKKFKIFHRGFKIENEIFWKGITHWQEGVSMEYWLKACEFSNIIFDVGAYHGIYSLASKAINSRAKIYAFEPVEYLYMEMKKNIMLNKFQIYSFNLALSDTDGIAKFYNVNNKNSKIGSLSPDYFREDAILTEVETKSISTFIYEQEIKKIDLMKVDVEGYEFQVLQGMGKHLKEMMPVILIEVLTDKSAGKIQRLIEGTDYLIFDIDEKHRPKKIDKLRKSAYFNLMLCNPDDAKKLKLI